MSAGETRAVRYRKPAELARLGARHAVVEASAGTGKTYILEHLVVDLVLARGASIDQILVVTFTEKATAELGVRIRRKLEELAALVEDHPNAAGAPDEACWLIDERARARIGDALLGFDRAAISTIHGFCQRLLTEHAFLHRRLFREEAIAEDEAFGTAFAEVLRRQPAADATTAELVSYWIASGNPLAKLRRAVGAAVRGVACLHPRRGEALRPAVIDEGRVLELLTEVMRAPGGDAFKATLKKAKVHHSTATAVADKWTELQSICATASGPQDLPRTLAEIDAFDRRRDEALKYLWSKLDPGHADPEIRAVATLYRRFATTVPTLLAALVTRLCPVVLERLESSKREAGHFDFQDMLNLVAEGLAGDGPRARALLATLRARYRYGLIDEFQDTDEVQWGIFRRIFFDSRAGHVLTVIGDPKQAIYAFRGADVHTYLAAVRAITDAGGERVFLTENFRSTGDVIAAYNAILDQQAPFFRPEGGILYDHPVTCGRPGLRLVEGAGEPAPGVVVLDVETTAKSLLTYQVKRALLGRMAREMKSLLGDGPLRFGEHGAEAPVRAGDIYVVTRTTRESREVGDALRAVGVPFAFFKQEKLFDTVEARDLLDLLRAIADPDDVTARARAFITPFFGLGLADLAACDDLDPGEPLLRLLYEWRALAEAGDFETLFARIIEGSGVVCRNVFLRDDERSLTNTLHLIEILQEEAARARTTIRELSATLGAFIAGTRRPPGEGRDIQRLETEADAVQIMTIHHAKGLEAAVVFLYGGFWTGPSNDVRVLHDEAGRRVCDVGRATPDVAEIYGAEQDDEERRVLYVALTRAKARLYLPRYPIDEFKYLRGAYRFINARLHDLLGGFTDPELRARFHRVAVPCPGEPLPELLPASPATVAAWAPAPELLAPSDEIARRARGLARAGFVTTSYSALKRAHGGFVAPAALPDDAELEDEKLIDPGDAAAALPREALPGETAPDDLPPGRITGRFLHSLLEEVPLAGIGAEPWQTWAARPEITALFERVRRRYDVAAVHVPAAARLVHGALTTPVPLGAATLPGFAQAARSARELEFIYPIPERRHPLLGAGGGFTHSDADGGAFKRSDADGGAFKRSDADGGAFKIGRGIIKGYIDLLFEHDGRAYVCDWKGDALPGWDADAVAGHVARNYDLQARLYTIGTLRLLGISDEAAYEQRFGGVVYAFLRGMSAAQPGRGIAFTRPRFAEVLAWQDELVGDRYWRSA